ncbi:hypothetical protein GCM10010517_69760 [Streptosporangium fragile]|uniref:Uncharacterized protein n=1 Tax=Streptosporangium fragile TaxID=46186 RepID=A0ABN3W9S9_9ACTN
MKGFTCLPASPAPTGAGHAAPGPGRLRWYPGYPAVFRVPDAYGAAPGSTPRHGRENGALPL